jgi:hypothetical protein
MGVEKRSRGTQMILVVLMVQHGWTLSMSLPKAARTHRFRCSASVSETVSSLALASIVSIPFSLRTFYRPISFDIPEVGSGAQLNKIYIA